MIITSSAPPNGADRANVILFLRVCVCRQSISKSYERISHLVVLECDRQTDGRTQLP